MRLTLAPTSALTDARGHNKKARPRSLAAQGQAVVSNPYKPTGVSVGALAPVSTSTHPGKRTQLKLAMSLSPRPPGRSRYGVDNERSPI